MNSYARIDEPKNEPILSYAPGTKERAELQEALSKMSSEEIEIPLIIGGKEVRTGKMGKAVMPHDHGHVLAKYHMAGAEEVKMAIEAAQAAWKTWSEMPWEERAAIFMRAAELLAGPWRARMNAAAMLDLSKTAFQAEIDAACELIDFFRFNTYFMTQLYQMQPYSPLGQWNRTDYRPLEGFVFAVTPFNFASIAGNLPGSPALMGNTVLWKPASSAVYMAYHIMKLYEAAGMPPGVINFVPGPGGAVGNVVLNHSDLAGIHFTGSVPTFQFMWKTVGQNISNYRMFPRIVGETGGKDFVFVHASADPLEVATALTRGAFEYQGQKCSAASRTYIPESLWPQVKEHLLEQVSRIKMGDPADFTNFMTAVIDQHAFRTITSYIDLAKKDTENVEILAGGEYDDSKGWFVSPTVLKISDPHHRIMEEEIFGPVLAVYVYEDSKLDETLDLCDTTSPYGLTGAVFARDREAVIKITRGLRHAAGNFYINDKPTGAVVNQQPFGGSRASGTNDKAGSIFNLLRWTSVRSIKETYIPPTDFVYPFMQPDK